MLCCLVLTACGTERGHVRRATVFYASGADLQSINPLVTVHPLAKAVQKHVMFLTLAAYDSTLRPVPRLASWAWSGDRTTLTFELRRDVVWHDGVPTTASRVVVHYTGALIDGTVFDSSRKGGKPATFGVTQVIGGWTEALQLMKVGAQWKLFIPSKLAYGPRAQGPLIGANSALVFDVELISIQK